MLSTKKKYYLSKRAFLTIIFFHIIIVTMLFWNERKFFAPKQKKVSVNYVVVQSPSPQNIKKKEIAPLKKQTVKNSAPKKLVKKTPSKNKIDVSSSKKKSLIESIEKSLDEINTSKSAFARSKDSVVIPQKIKALSIDMEIDSNTFVNEDAGYQQLLIQDLQEKLRLPEEGCVKVKLFINSNGNIKNIDVLQSYSEKNKTYLKNTLQQVVFPWFNRYCSNSNGKEVTILFKNEDR
jgi:hypothetical protein